VPDPLLHVRRFHDPLDQEIAGLIGALFAYGRVDGVCRTVDTILQQLSPSPRAALLEGRHLQPEWGAGFRYRFNSRSDLCRLLEGVAGMLRQEGSLGRALAQRRRSAGDLASALDLWVRDLRALSAGAGKMSPGLRFLLAEPGRGSACKRWWLYLRWMIRPADGLDLGVWSKWLSPAELRVPLDAHWIRIGARLGLTSRRTPDARMAAEITDGLRALAPEDPLRYDFAVCHLGISGRCPPRLRSEHCRVCPLRQICARGSAASAAPPRHPRRRG